jgi:sugar phosphate isomerase/epimerase
MTVSKHASDGSQRQPRMEIFQAIWAMQNLPTSSRPWDHQEIVDRIREAGFSGALAWVADLDKDFEMVERLRRSGLMVGIGFPAHEGKSACPLAERAKALGVSFLNAQVHDAFVDDDRAVERLETLYDECDATGMPLFVETHRGTITQDLLRTIAYGRRVPRMRYTLDASHYVVAGEVTQPGVAPHFTEALSEIVERSSSIHARVSNGEQVQVDIGDGSGALVAPYLAWWTSAYQHWLCGAAPGDFFPFVCELGPAPYAITVPDGTSLPAGTEISDRFAQALTFKRLAEGIRQEAESEGHPSPK